MHHSPDFNSNMIKSHIKTNPNKKTLVIKSHGINNGESQSANTKTCM